MARMHKPLHPDEIPREHLGAITSIDVAIKPVVNREPSPSQRQALRVFLLTWHRTIGIVDRQVQRHKRLVHVCRMSASKG